MTNSKKYDKENIYSLKGFDKVFKFTLKQTFKNKAYIVSLVMFILIMAFMGPIQYFTGKSGNNAAEGMESSKISDPVTQKVIVLDETALGFSIEDLELKELGLEGVDAVLINGQDIDINYQIRELGKNDVIVYVTRDMEGYKVSAIQTDDSEVPSDELSNIASYFEGKIGTLRMEKSGLGEEDVKLVQSGVSTGGITSEKDFKESESNVVSRSKMMSLSMIFAILIMIVSTMSSSYIVASVTEEKTSKLVESLLVSVRPMALLMGKIIGMMVYILTILVGGFLASQISNLVMKYAFNIDVTTGVSQFDFGALFSFGIGGTVIVIISILLAYIAFGGLSGMMGSACTRTEDVQSATGTVMTIVMVGYLGATMAASMDSSVINTVAAFIPPFSFYTSTVYFLAGRISLPVFAISFAVQILIVIGIILLCAKTYRRLILNDSSKPKMTDIIRAMKN
jgi:hypothetical protein